MEREEGERTDQCMGGLRGMGGASKRGRKKDNMITLKTGGLGSGSEFDGHDEERKTREKFGKCMERKWMKTLIV